MNDLQTTNYQAIIAALPIGCSPDFTAGAFWLDGFRSGQQQTPAMQKKKGSTARGRSANGAAGDGTKVNLTQAGADLVTAVKNQAGITFDELPAATGLDTNTIGSLLGPRMGISLLQAGGKSNPRPAMITGNKQGYWLTPEALSAAISINQAPLKRAARGRARVARNTGDAGTQARTGTHG